MDMQFQEIEHFLKNIDPKELIDNIASFRKLNFKKMSEQDIFKEILKVLCFPGKFCYLPNILKYPKNTKFFRVRKLKSSNIKESGLTVISDFWNPPEKCVNEYGRLNKPHESLLYTSPINPLIAINEMKLKKDDYYAVIVYLSQRDIQVNCIGGNYDYDKLGIRDKNAILVNEIYNNFFIDEFSRDVGEGTEYLYKISESIAKSYFDLPPRVFQDAWLYPSVQNKSMCNVCFRPEIAKESLLLQGAIIAEKKEDNNDIINVVCITHGFDANGFACYYPLGTDVQKEIFPEIIRIFP